MEKGGLYATINSLKEQQDTNEMSGFKDEKVDNENSKGKV